MPVATPQALPAAEEVIVRNRMDGVTVYTSRKGAYADYLRWAGKDDPNGEDIVPVPADIASEPQFRQVLRKGVLEVVTDEEVARQAMDAQHEHWKERQQALADQSTASLDMTPNNDLVSYKCVGPATRGDGRCGTDVPLREEDAKSQPPLCSQHANLRHQFVPEKVLGEDGKVTTNWSRVTLGKRERQQVDTTTNDTQGEPK